MIWYILYVTKYVLCNYNAGGANKMVLLSLDVTDLTFNSIINFIAVLIIFWFVIKNYLDMRDRSIKGFTRKQGWDKAAKVIDEKEKVWDDAVADVNGMREFLMERYDSRLDNIEQQIQDNHKDTNNDIKEVKSEILLLTECMRAVLDGLHQLKCNGKVTEASEKLDTYLVGLVGKN